MERGARAHETKVGLENAINLWQLGKTRFSEEWADSSKVRLRIWEKMGGHLRSIHLHCAKLWHTKNSVVAADTVRPVESGTSRGKFNCYGNYHHSYTEQRQYQDSHGYIKYPFCARNHPGLTKYFFLAFNIVSF